MTHPYKGGASRRFWAPAVGKRHFLDIEELWQPRYEIRRDDKIATFGSCFAQHIGRALAARGYDWINTEPAPSTFGPEAAARFNYGIFTARTANIYTTSLLHQWTTWALRAAERPHEVWQRGDRHIDPFRPLIEPDGFASVEELRASADCVNDAFRDAIETADVFVFTLGLTESWHNRDGYEYPMCPGTAGGEFDPHRHEFRNQDYVEVRDNLLRAIDAMRAVNPTLRFLLTVSPVPLTATATDDHVLVATMRSKSALRAVAGQVAADVTDVDYFPSYEIINSPVFRGTFFEPNLRSVNPRGVAHVMDTFFTCQQTVATTPLPPAPPDRAATADEVCEEELLGAFGAR